MPEPKKIRVAVNGYGVIGKRVADAVVRQEDISLAGVSDVVTDWRARVATGKGFRLFGATAEHASGMRAAGLGTGNKLTFGGHAVLTSKVSGHAYAIEAETLHSRFDGSSTSVYGGYFQGQIAISRLITPVVRYDVVQLDRGGRPVKHRAVRLGINCNVPNTRELINIHIEYAHNRIDGPADFVTHSRSLDELRAELRLSATRYLRF